MKAFILLSLVALLGCAVTYPPGWRGDQEPSEVLQATPGVMYGAAPLSWDLHDGGKIRIDVGAASVVSGAGVHAAKFRFAADYADDPGPGIDCASEPQGPGVPQTRFGCWSRADPAALRFWLAPDLDCSARYLQTVKTMTRPECWQGELELHGERLGLRHGFLRSSRAVVGYVTWVDEAEQPLLAADIVREMQIRLYPGTSKATPELRRSLVLLTVALAWWEQATSPN